MKSLLKACALFAAVLAVAAGVAACGGDSEGSGNTGQGDTGETASSDAGSGSTSIDLGTQTIDVESDGPPKIGFFAYGLSAYELSYAEEIERMNAEEGTDVTWVEAKFDAATQLKQLQTALRTKEFDAWIIEAVDAEGSCRLLTEQAPEAGIPVSIVINPTCGLNLEPWGKGMWAEGTLNIVSNTANVTWFTNVLDTQQKALEIGPDTKVGVIHGPDLAAQAQTYEKAVEESEIEPVESVAGDYTAPTAQKLTSAMLSRHPDIEVMLTGFEGATPGIIAALKQAGKEPGEVRVGDIGGSSEISVPNLKSGWLTVTAVYDPKLIARTAIEQMELAFAGEQGPRLLPADPPGSSLEEPPLVTKADLGSFEPTY